MEKTLILAANPGAYCYPWANNDHIMVTSPQHALDTPGFIDWFDKVILINGVAERWLFHPALRGKETCYFLWDPARCPRYAPGPEALARIRRAHRAYSFQREDCEALGLRFNSTFYAPPPPGLYAQAGEALYDVLFLGVPKDRMPLLRALHRDFSDMGLRVKLQIGLTAAECAPEEAPGWKVTNAWALYTDYLHWVMQSRCLLDVYQSIQTGFSLRVMEHIFFGKKLITNNGTLTRAEFYHPNNIFLLGRNSMESLKSWLNLPFVEIDDSIREYYHIESWVKRFT